MTSLFEVNISDENMRKGKSTKFITKIRRNGLFRNNLDYFNNTIYNKKDKSKNTSIIMAIMKNNYDHFIFEEGWDELKLERVINKIIRDNEAISQTRLASVGLEYDIEIDKRSKRKMNI